MADTPLANTANTHQYEAWNGYEGRHWADHQTRYDALNDGMNAPLLEAAALRAMDTVLDIGCGNGSVTRLAARRARHAVGIDLSAPMLERARATAEAEGLPHVTHVQGDAQVHAFEPSTFDVAVSRYGVMFFGDPVAAFTNIAGALREGGRLAFVCPRSFDRQDQARVFAAVSEHVPLPDLTAASETGPASFADRSRVRAVLSAAGFEGIEVTPLEAEQVWGRDPSDASAFLFGWGPMRHWLRDAPEDAVARAREAATEVFGRYATENGVRLKASCWLVTATRA
ncbi:methyltransferase domain-containing protein [Streptomyces sp. DSM 41972]|uniref:Methyltransferase domain-containing protein n=1 Tax=Streptomyces althioticus subsp. attaecolombicae TaxID=3075534 RepID=A0ABU3I298_9ACTN|nr:methyltransferase domain-containing protein [Streptomyces sp. DSM 41972]SCD33392.1 Methyltransferase domain-containing protein [Streptomyces sp. di50b]SCD35183.1 Methyltransferase domain-containing protein [Streptomyces sp. di188]